MNNEFASMLEQPGFVSGWAKKVKYGVELSSDEKEINSAVDSIIKDIGRTGYDRDHEIAAIVQRTFTPEVVMAPGEVLGRMFNLGSIGEFDDSRHIVAPKNTIKVYQAPVGGNVDASYIDHSIVTSTWIPLQAETYIPMMELRYGGYKTVANYLTFINEAFEQKRVSLVMTALAALITNGAANYINEASTLPTDTSMQALCLYLADVANGDAPFTFGLNKYIQAVGNLALADKNKTDVEKSMWFTDGFLRRYSGIDMIGFSGQKKLADGSYLVPNNTLIGVAGKVGNLDMKGDTRVLEETDINNETVHVKVTGYHFGYAITDLTKAAKVVIA